MSYFQDASPESLGISSGGILRFLDRMEEKNIELHSFMVVRHGKCAAKGWWKPYAPELAHPLYSFCAYGAGAEQIVRDHPLDYGLGPKSPLQKLYERDAKILLLGTTFETNTSLHLAEYFANRPDIEESAPILVDGEKQWVSFKNIDLDIFDDFLEVQREFFTECAANIHKEPLPNGEASCFRMRDCVELAKRHYQQKG